MKKIQQLFVAFLPLVVFTLMLTGCAKNRLQQVVAEVNEKCPVSLGQFARMMEVTYNEGNVAIRYEMDDRVINIDSMRQNETLMKQQLLSTYCQPNSEFKEFTEAIIEAQATLKFVYAGYVSGEEIAISITPEELKRACEETVLSPEDILDAMLQLSNSQFPLVLADGMSITCIKKEGDTVYYIYEVSDADIFNNLQADVVNLKASTRYNLEHLSEVEKADLRKIPAANKSLGYRYINTITGDSIEYTFTQRQMTDILR